VCGRLSLSLFSHPVLNGFHIDHSSVRGAVERTRGFFCPFSSSFPPQPTRLARSCSSIIIIASCRLRGVLAAASCCCCCFCQCAVGKLQFSLLKEVLNIMNLNLLKPFPPGSIYVRYFVLHCVCLCILNANGCEY
jgi:hypothetical protein